MSRFYDIGQVCDHPEVKVSRMTIMNWLKSGLLPRRRFGKGKGVLYFLQEDIDRISEIKKYHQERIKSGYKFRKNYDKKRPQEES